MGRIADLAVGFPGYYGRIGHEHGMLPEILADNGYVPVAVGKWHLTPDDETHAAAPRDTWPTGRGFQRWYGFHGGETHQFVPSLYQDNHAVVPPRTPEEGYHLSEDLADRAITYLGDIRSAEPDKPFLLYFATGACHSPHHAPLEWRERYRGQFDAGWDVWREATFQRQRQLGLLPEDTELSPRPPWVPAWDDLHPEDQAVAARFMECFAAYLSHADAQIGRVIDAIEAMGESDNTIVVLISDNGASAEGGERGSINDARLWNGMPAGRKELRARIDEIGTQTAHNNYPWGWTMAGNTPFRRWKREVHEGGIADPCIVRWPRGIAARGEVRHQFAHAIDVLPTLLELIGVEPPAELEGRPQSSLEGTSFATLLHDAAASAPHVTQYFEMLGSRGIHHDGWKAVTFKPMGHLYGDGLDPAAPFEDDVWELYHVDDDLSECHDLAETEPEKLAELVELWWDQARRYKVLPLDNRPLAALEAPRRPFHERSSATYYPFGAPIPEELAINVKNRSHRITATIEAPEGRALEGVILSIGTVLGGWSFQAYEGKLRYVFNFLGRDRFVITSDTVIEPGTHEVAFALAAREDYSGTGRLFLDGAVVGEGEIAHLTPARYTITGAGMSCGWEQGPPIGNGYTAPFRFTGTLGPVHVVRNGASHRDLEGEFEAIMAEQ
jgi:arylsulfatase